MFCNSSNKFLQLVFIILVSLFIAMPAYAGTFYVRPDGNDLNSGAENTPSGAWKTIQKAADTLNPSDTVEVQSGTYNEQVTIIRSGLSNQYITFKAQGEVIIDGQNARPYCIKLDGADYIKIEGFTIRNSTQTGILIDNNANYNLITNNICHNHPNIGIKLDHDSNYNTISNNTLYNNKGGTNAYGNRICGIYVHNYSDYNTIDSNIAYQNGTGIWLEGNSSYCTITNNKTYSNGYIGIIIVGGTNNNTVLNNLIYSNYNSGMHIGYSAQYNTVKNNTIYKNGVHGIMFDYSSPNNTIKNNIITQNGLTSNSYYGINIYDLPSQANNIFYNNIYKNGLDGTRNYGGFATQSPLDTSLEPYFKSTDPLNPDFLKLKSLSSGDSLESPCIDSGDPNDTPSSQSGKRIDQGAYDLYSHSPIQGGLLAEYFDNQNFTSLKLTRIDPRINFDWGNSTPDALLGVDTFSIRWQGQIKIDYAQNYTFYITTDDGSRLWIDNQLIIDKWFDQGPTEHSATINLTPGLHDIKYEYYENGGWAVAKLYWSSPSINKSLIPSDHLYYFGTLPQDSYIQGGLKGTYSKFTDFYGAPSYVFTRIDPQINFDWGGNMAAASLNFDKYLIKWKGKVKIERTDTFTFYTTTDDGVRLWVNNQLLVDAWWDQGATERQGSIYLTPGLYDIELDYYENGGLAVSKLYWSSTSISKSLIPPTNLYYEKEDSITGGLYAEYFDNIDLTNPKIKRQDPNIDYDWVSFAPDSLIQSDTYSVRWQGQVKADYSETYTFYTNSDDGLKLWIDNQLLINTWFDHGPYEASAPINLTQGWHDIKVEYYENGGWAAVKLSYSSPSTPKTIIPQDHLRTTLSAEDASLNLYSTLNNAQDVQTPYMGHSGTIIQTGTGVVTFESAKFDKGVLLNGTPDMNNKELIQLSSSDLNKKEGTIEFWFKPNWNSDDGVWHKLFSTDWNWDGTIEIFKYSNNSLYWKIVKEGVQHAIVSDSSRKWNAGEWHHLAFSYGPAGMKFYLDFTEIPINSTFHNESPYAGPLPETFASDIYLGGDGGGYVPSDAIFDEIKLYNKQLIPSDTKAPIFNITSHQNNDVVNSSPITISGTIDDNTATVIAKRIGDEAIYSAYVSNGTFTSQPIALALGPNTIIVEAQDQSSNISSNSITLIYVDITPPSTPTVNPVTSPTKINTQELSGTKEANSSIWINGSQAVPLDNQTTWSKVVDLYEGTNNFSITSKDASNNESGAVLATIVLDTIAPTGTIKINNDAQYTKSTQVSLTLSATDAGTGVSKMQFSNDGINYSTPEDYTTTKPWNLSAGDGTKTVYARFKDAAENWTQQEIKDTIILDTTAPTQPTLDTLTSPTNINSQTITGTKSTDTTSVIIVTCPTATVGEVTYPTSTTWSCLLTNLTEGTNDITVTAIDAAGNESTATSGTIVLDTIAPAQPTIDPVTSPTDVNFQTITGTKLTDTTSITVTCPTASVGEVTYPTTTTWVCQLTNLTEGDNNITATAQDAAGNPSIPKSTTITYQPYTGLTLKITSHQNNARVNTSPITVSGTVSDSTATVTVNDIPAEVIGNTFTAPNIPLTAGTNIITARATKDTETAEYTINVILDLDPPSINIYIPDANSTTRSNIVYGRVSDDTASVIARRVGDEAISAELLSDFRFIARPTLTEGANTITVEATDKAGNTNQSSINITYDTTTPKVTITSPLDNSTIDISPIKVEGTNTSDLKYILIRSLPAHITEGTFTVENVTLYSDHTVITAEGYDLNDNLFEDSVFIRSPQLANYQLTEVSGDAYEYDEARPVSGATQTLKVKLEKNSQPAVNEEIQFNIIEGNGTLSQSSVFTDVNGEAQVILTTDTDSSVTNKVDCFVSSNPLVKTTFVVYTKPGAPSNLTKISDDTITPVPGAAVDLIVKLTDSNNNPIPNENINFQITQGQGSLSSAQAATTYYGEAKITLTVSLNPRETTQVTAASATNSTLNVVFNITTSQATTLTFNDIMAKVQANEDKILDLMADVVVTSNDPNSYPEKHFKLWMKGNKSKVEVLSPIQKTSIIETTSTSINLNGQPFLDIIEGQTDPDITRTDTIESSSGDVYVLKTVITSTQGFEEITRYYVDYAKGVFLKTEDEYKDQYKKEFLEIIYSYVQINDIWIRESTTTKVKDFDENTEYATVETLSNIIINSGIPDSVFQ